jgi:hypothetical protein
MTDGRKRKAPGAGDAAVAGKPTGPKARRSRSAKADDLAIVTEAIQDVPTAPEPVIILPDRNEAVQTTHSDLAREIMGGNPELISYRQSAREALVAAIERRREIVAETFPESKVSTDSAIRRLRELLSRFDKLDACVKGFILQADGATAPNEVVAAAVIDELIAGVTALLGIELEAVASQSRIMASALVQEYAGSSRAKPVTLSWDVDQHAADAFRSLHNAVKEYRARRMERREPYTQEDFLLGLVALGISNVPLLAALGAPELQAAPLGIQAVRRAAGKGSGYRRG